MLELSISDEELHFAVNITHLGMENKPKQHSANIIILKSNILMP